jgi:hypothetical protein
MRRAGPPTQIAIAWQADPVPPGTWLVGEWVCGAFGWVDSSGIGQSALPGARSRQMAAPARGCSSRRRKSTTKRDRTIWPKDC